MAKAEVRVPFKQIWCVYNHLPGGQVMAIHFEDFMRGKKDGDRTVDVLITAKEQAEAFKRTPQVALNIKGKVVAREVLVYEGPDVQGKFEAADMVLAWAREKGIEPIRSQVEMAKDANAPGAARVAALETKVEGLEKGQNTILEKLDQLLKAPTT